MKCAIIVSSLDKAGLNIKSKLVRHHGFVQAGELFDRFDVYTNGRTNLYTLTGDITSPDQLEKKIKADCFIFASKHQSRQGTPSLSVHAIGNFGPADFGGEAMKLVEAPGAMLKAGLQKLEEKVTCEKKQNPSFVFEVIQEATHHGPYVRKPCMFIEIGSSALQWSSDRPGEIIAQTIKELITEDFPTPSTAIGIGGLHHCPNFKKIMLYSEIAMTHICAKYNLGHIDEKLVRHALDRSLPRAGMIILDWKGMKDQKTRIVKLLDEANLKVMRTNEF